MTLPPSRLALAAIAIAAVPLAAMLHAQTATPTAAPAPAATPAPAAPPMPTTAPGSLNPALVQAGTYATDAAHTLVGWRINHMGFNDYFGQFGNVTGSLTLDPRRPAAARLSLDIPVDSLAVVSSDLRNHLLSADFFGVVANPSAHFESTRIVVRGQRATITGNLTLKGQTHPVTLNAVFAGAGTNPWNHKPTIGFSATGSLSRSQFGMGYGVPIVGDRVDLTISVAFEKQ